VIRVGVDVGGTFTDLVLYNSNRREIRRHKLLTTPAEPDIAVADGLSQLINRAGVQADEIADFVYATTVATNAVLQRRSPRICMITTDGFRDILLIQRQKRYEMFDLFIDKPQPLLRRSDIFEVSERIDSQGRVVTPLDVSTLDTLIRTLADRGAETLAICFIHSYCNPLHELTVLERVTAIAPHLDVSLSHAVSPLAGEYERFSTTVTDAYVKPVTATHIRRLEQRLREMGVHAEILVMLSDGGVADVDRATASPVRLIESGPAAGVEIAAFVGRQSGESNIIAFDMGGTTAKVALVEEGRPWLSDELEIDRVRLLPGSGLPLRIPSVDIIEIGQGGGSIAVVEQSVLRVGPQSAGAVPGPACYGAGGHMATVTDADVVLGYINPDYYLGGRMALDVTAAQAAIASDVAGPLGLDLEGAARGVYEVVNANMQRAIRAASVQRGRDPRDYVLVATGGAGPVHAVSIARTLGIRRVIIPPASGVASAMGLLAAAPRATFARTVHVMLDQQFGSIAREIFDALAREARQALSGRDSANVVLSRSIAMRYVGQGYDVTVPVPGEPAEPIDIPALQTSFHRAYHTLYGRSEEDEPVEVTTWRIDATLPAPDFTIRGTGGDASAASAIGRRRIYDVRLQQDAEATIWRLHDGESAVQVVGPAVIEQPESTIVVFTGDAAVINGAGYTVITVGVGVVDAAAIEIK
jgi:N-methylhydantoinase A